KLVTHGPDRAQAIEHMSRALDAFVLDGIQHNVSFLSSLMAHPRWRAGDLTTKFIAEEYPDGFISPEAEGEVLETLIAVAAWIDHLANLRRGTLSSRSAGANALRHVELDGALHGFTLEEARDVNELLARGVRLTRQANGTAGQTRHVDGVWWPGEPLWRGTVDGRAVVVQVRPVLNGYTLDHAGHKVTARVYTDHEAGLVALMPVKEAPDTSKMLLCPMPGLVTALAVEVGQQISAGDALCTVEAMKMENVLKAERDGTVSAIHAAPGDSLAVDAVIMEFE
ncbi:MAG: biotin/lipoyl-containing protein, partial [Pseudomonadota bacterium]